MFSWWFNAIGLLKVNSPGDYIPDANRVRPPQRQKMRCQSAERSGHIFEMYAELFVPEPNFRAMSGFFQFQNGRPAPAGGTVWRFGVYG
jgi:hypothetical protein